MGKLTTHVLDLMHGKPAAGMRIELRSPVLDAPVVAVTNSDGRCDAPLLADGDFEQAEYELRFYVAEYFSSLNVPLPEPTFLTVVPICFSVADPKAAYHVPLLVSPWAYSTYRGS